MAEPEVPSRTDVPLVAQGDGSTSLWGGLFLPMGQGPADATPLPDWAPHGELLRDADPARFYAIDFLIWTLCFNFSQELAVASKRVARPIPQAVESVGLADPLPFMAEQSSQFDYPLLCVYRRRSSPGQVASSYPFRTSRWEIRYVLPGLGFEAASRLAPIFEAVEASVEDMVWKGYHPQYAPPGGVLGQLVFQKAGMMEVETLDSAWEYADTSDGGGIVHAMLRMEWDVKVRKMDVRTAPGAPAVRGAPVPLSGTDTTIAVAAEGGDPNPVPIVTLKTDGPASGS